MKKLLLIGLMVSIAGCGNSSGNAGGTGGEGAGGEGGTPVFSATPPLTIGGDRPSEVAIPTDYDPEVQHPLIIVLHGASANGLVQARFFWMFDFIDEKDYVLGYPDGINNVWNATPFCCSPDGPDDVGYVRELIEEAQRTYNIDANRVYLIGHSNGGFLSFRMACEASDLITAIVSLAGSSFNAPEDCQPGTTPVSTLVVHGTADGTIFYNGLEGAYPGAIALSERQAARAGCDMEREAIGEIDIVTNIEGDDTNQEAYTSCNDGLSVELWTIPDGPHVPPLQPSWADLVTDWMYEHTR